MRCVRLHGVEERGHVRQRVQAAPWLRWWRTDGTYATPVPDPRWRSLCGGWSAWYA
jgi:hypothetical protein